MVERVDADAYEHIRQDVTEVRQSAAQDHQFGRNTAQQAEFDAQDRNALNGLIHQTLPDEHAGVSQHDEAADAGELLYCNAHWHHGARNADSRDQEATQYPVESPDVGIDPLDEDEHQKIERPGHQARQSQPQGMVEEAHENLPVLSTLVRSGSNVTIIY